MKKYLIMIVLSGLWMQVQARGHHVEGVSRAEVLLEAKYLYRTLSRLQNKYDAWQKRKATLIEEFEEKLEDSPLLGSDNHFGRDRIQRRRKVFFTSLKRRDAEIEKELYRVKKDIESIKGEFSHLYAVPLTQEEIAGGNAPKVINKAQKIQILQRFLRAKRTWKSCMKKVDRFDSQRIELEMQLGLSERKYQKIRETLEKKYDKNMLALVDNDTKAQMLLQEYNSRFGEDIQDVQTAQTLLNNIKHAP